MRNFIPERMVRATDRMMRMNIDDGDIFIGEFANGALCSIQTSFVTVGNYPGIEARLYGSKGALICRLVEEFGICETLKAATPDAVEFRELRDPVALLPAGRQLARELADALLRQPHRQLHHGDPERRPGERRRLRRRRLDPGSHQRRRALVPRTPLGLAAAGMTADLSAFFESYYRLRPVNATFTGIHDYDDRLPDWSPVSLESALDEMHALRQSLADAAEPPPASLHDVGARDRALACAFLDIQIAEVDSRHFQRGNPSLAAGEAIFGVIGLMTRPFAPAAARVEAATSRLAAIPAFLAGARRSFSGPIPLHWREKTIKECEGANRLFELGVPRWLKNEATAASAAERAARRRARGPGRVPRFPPMAGKRAGRVQSEYGCGAELFDLLLARGHWSSRRRSDLAAEARAALDEALARLHEQAAPAGGWSAVQARLAEVHPPADAYLSTYQRLWDACRQRATELDLVTWPDFPIRYVADPRADARCGAVPVLPLLPLAGALRSPAGSTTTSSRPSSPTCRPTSASAGCAPPTGA